MHYSPTGVEHLPHDLFRQQGVVLTNGAGLYAQPIAERVVMCILAARLNLLGLLRAQTAAAWVLEVESEQELSGSVALILGYGALGRAVAARLIALGVTVLAARRGSSTSREGTSSTKQPSLMHCRRVGAEGPSSMRSCRSPCRQSIQCGSCRT